MASYDSHSSSSCGICGIENLFFPPLPPRPSKLLPLSSIPESSSSSNSDNSPGEGKDMIDLGKEKIEENDREEEKKKKKDEEGQENGKIIKGRKAFPPPITCLRNVKRGKPFSYVSFDEGSKTYVVEKVNIPNGDFLHATMEDGTLRLSMKKFSEEE